MISLTAEEFALLEDEISQLRSENEYLKIQLDGALREHQDELAKAWRLGWWSAADASGVRIPPHSNPYSDRVNC